MGKRFLNRLRHIGTACNTCERHTELTAPSSLQVPGVDPFGQQLARRLGILPVVVYVDQRRDGKSAPPQIAQRHGRLFGHFGHDGHYRGVARQPAARFR